MNKVKLKRFVRFSICNAPGTLIELFVLWLLADVLFTGSVAQFLIAPIIAFECAVIIDFSMFHRFVWHENVKIDTPREFFHRLLMFNVSTLGVYLLRLLTIQLLHWLLHLDAVLCDILAMILSGILNFGINDSIIFSAVDNHRPWVRVLIGLVRPFVSLKVVGLQNIPNHADGPLVYVCNHGFFFGPIAAIMNIPDKVRPWIDSSVLDFHQCKEDVNRIVGRRFRHLGYTFKSKIIDRISHWVISLLNDFNPIPVFKNGSRGVVNTINESVDALVEGENLLIFPEHPRKNSLNIAVERREASSLRSFYNGFARIAQDFYKRTGKILQFVPVYVNQKRHTMQIAPAVAFSPCEDSRAGRELLANTLFDSLSKFESQ